MSNTVMKSSVSALRSAPAFIKISAQLTCPWNTASCSGVQSDPFRAFTFAPRSTNSWRHWWLPSIAARWSGVSPLHPTRLKSTFLDFISWHASTKSSFLIAMSNRMSAGNITRFSTRVLNAGRGNVLVLLLQVFQVDDRWIVRFGGGSDRARFRRSTNGERFSAANSCFVSGVVARLLKDSRESSSTDTKPLEMDSFVWTDSIEVLSDDFSISEKPDELSLYLLQSDTLERLERHVSASFIPRRFTTFFLFKNWDESIAEGFFLVVFKSNSFATFCLAFSDNSSNCNRSLVRSAFPARVIIWTSIRVIASSRLQSNGILPRAHTEQVSAPCWNNNSASSLSPISEAIWSGVRPCLSLALTFRPLSSKMDTNIKLPSWHARCKAHIMWQSVSMTLFSLSFLTVFWSVVTLFGNSVSAYNLAWGNEKSQDYWLCVQICLATMRVWRPYIILYNWIFCLPNKHHDYIVLALDYWRNSLEQPLITSSL